MDNNGRTGQPFFEKRRYNKTAWIPACAGMTEIMYERQFY
jgi:hypothetical protein